MSFNPKTKFNWFILAVIQDIFKASLATLVVFFFIEYLKSGFVTNYLNLNIILIVTLISGIITVLAAESNKEDHLPKRLGPKENLVIFVLAFLVGLILYIKTREIGWLSYLISLSSILIVIFISKSILEEEK